MLRKKLGLPMDGDIAVYTGRLVSTKGLPSLLRAWRRVVNRRPDAHLLLVGEGGVAIQNCENELRHFVREQSLEDQVTFTGSVENVHEYLQASDLFVFPTEREAFGISTIEAMSCALPVIATDVGGLNDIITADETAIVVPPGDAMALEAAIDRVLENDASIRRIADAGRALVVDRYSEPRVLQQYQDLLSGLIPDRSVQGQVTNSRE
ncbi:MAG: glycosyltransferase family 4 protein [Gammaproteobacteria bacterium]|nr:glycosyltransferase family 4 protein [Gammaproteobacteria bacterium]